MCKMSSVFRVSQLKELEAKMFQIIFMSMEGSPIIHSKLLGREDTSKDSEFIVLRVP